MTSLFDDSIDPSDEGYKYIRDVERFKPDRQYLEELWQRFEPFADPEFRIEIASNFQGRFWEMYLACALLDLGFELEARESAGPDVCVRTNPGHVWLEATAPDQGTGGDAVPPPKYGGEAERVPEEQITLRIQSAIWDKHKKHNEYRKSGRIAAEDPYVIAINGKRIREIVADSSPPLIVKAVFPFGSPYVVLDRETHEIVGEGYQYRPGIEKASGAVVDTDFFMNNTYAGISAVLFSTVDALNRPSNPGGDFRLVHNPNAVAPLPLGWLPAGVEYWNDGEDLKHMAH